jgi:hypothetical protein
VWAENYIDAKKSEVYGGQEKVKEILYQDLGSAAEIAEELQGKPKWSVPKGGGKHHPLYNRRVAVFGMMPA